MNEKRENVVMDKSYSFALRIVSLYKFLVKERKEFVLSKQLLKSGTATIIAKTNLLQFTRMQKNYLNYW